MNKELYQTLKKNIQKNVKDLNLELERVKQEYIATNLPCDYDSIIELTHNSGRKEKMIVKAFTIYNDNVCVSQFKSIKDGKETGPTKFITAGHGEVKII